MTLPAVVTVDLRIIAPKAIKNGKTAKDHAYAEGAALRVAQGHHGGEEEADRRDDAAGARRRRAAPRVKVTTLEAPPARKAGIKVASVEELVAKLHNEAKVI